MSAIMGGSFLQGMQSGAIMGALTGIGGALGGGIGAALGGIAGNIVNAAVSGGDIGQAAAIGVVTAIASATIGTALQSFGASAGNNIGGTVGEVIGKFVGYTISGAIGGGIGSAMSGGDFITGFKYGAIQGAVTYVVTGAWADDKKSSGNSKEGSKSLKAAEETTVKGLVQQQANGVRGTQKGAGVKPGGGQGDGIVGLFGPSEAYAADGAIKLPSPTAGGLITKVLMGGGGALIVAGLLLPSTVVTIVGIAIFGIGAVRTIRGWANLPDTARNTASEIYNKTGMREYYEDLDTVLKELDSSK